MKPVFLVTNIPTPYRIPLFNELAHQFAEIGFRLKVLFARSGYAWREWIIDWQSVKFDYELLEGRALNFGAHENYWFFYPGLLRRIRRQRPAAVIVGGYSAATMVLRLSKFWTKTPFIVWSGEIRHQPIWRELLRRWLVRGASAYIAYGSAAKRYLVALGANPNRIAVAINTVETSFFGSVFASRMKRSEARARFRLVSVSGLFERKQMDCLIQIAARLSGRRKDFVLQIVGNGPERSKLEALAHALNVSDLVDFAGFKQKNEVANILRDSDCFLFPTSFDIWGLVLVEAMAAGVPCISSIHAGASADLIEEGKTGYAMDFSDVDSVCRLIEDILDNPKHARALGAAAHELVMKRASIRASAEGFVKAVEAVLGEDRPREMLAPVATA